MVTMHLGIGEADRHGNNVDEVADTHRRKRRVTAVYLTTSTTVVLGYPARERESMLVIVC
jgi:hypothetical protein